MALLGILLSTDRDYYTTFSGIKIDTDGDGDVMEAQKRIKQLMKERGWTDYRLAKESGLSHSTITNMFNRNNAPTLPTLEAVCDAFGITLAQFFSTEEDPHSLTEEQRLLFSRGSSLSEKQKELLLELMSTM